MMIIKIQYILAKILEILSRFSLLFIERLQHIGEVPICNGVAWRAPHFFGICFPLCYRCTFVIVGFIIGMLFFLKQWLRIRKIYYFLLIPMTIDGCVQTFLGVESSNFNRVITGFLFGWALACFVSWIYQKIDQFS